MPRSLCTYVSDERIPCIAYAVEGDEHCPVHRDKARLVRVSRRGKPEPVICIRCNEEIVGGTLQRVTKDGPVHAEFTCQPEEKAS